MIRRSTLVLILIALADAIALDLLVFGPWTASPARARVEARPPVERTAPDEPVGPAVEEVAWLRGVLAAPDGSPPGRRAHADVGVSQ